MLFRSSYYVFTGCLETLENEPIDAIGQVPTQQEKPTEVPAELELENNSDANILSEFDNEIVSDSEPFEYFVDFDEPTGEPLTDDDLYN